MISVLTLGFARHEETSVRTRLFCSSLIQSSEVLISFVGSREFVNEIRSDAD